MKEYNYTHKSSKVIEMHFYFDNLDKNSNQIELIINATSNVSQNSNKKEQYLLTIEFSITENKTKKVILFMNIANEFELNSNNPLTEKDINEIISTKVTPDCLGKGRAIIKDVSKAMGIDPIEVPEFDVENK